MRTLGADGHVGERVAVLVDVDRNRRAFLHNRAALVAFRQRLLAVLDPQPGQLRQRLECLVDGPVLVHVDLQRQLGDGAYCADALEVEAVPAAELQLQPAEPALRRRLLRAARHVVWIPQPDRP